ncbi:MAG TPA: hypothetical protein VNJ01_14400 [Bacteriovoracaceae bacterium]|nr:hypothetical protein [Bacteriovoracaceae bacterium]
MSKPISKPGKQQREERDKKLLLKHKYINRITVTRFGKECMDAGDYAGALKRYVEYMEIMTEVKEVKDIFSIRPQHFDPKKDLTELLMISHVYFEMARIYDAVPKYHEKAQQCLEQFVVFSANQPFQVINSELVRKSIKKSVFKNQEIFRKAYQDIFVQSKKCYVVTFCLGPEHKVTQEFRAFKDVLLDYQVGQQLVGIYYRYSSNAVDRWQDNPYMHFVGKYFIRPLLVFLSKAVLRFIIG